MAVRWRLVDSLGATYDLDEKVYLISEDTIEADAEMEEKNFIHGGVINDIKRIKSKDLSLKIIKHYDTDSAYRSAMNNIINKFYTAVKIQDIILNIETDVKFESDSIKYEDGSYLRVAEHSFNFKRKNPFWQDISYTTINITGTALLTTGSQSITNSGILPTPPLITLTAVGGSLAPNILLQVIETNAGLSIQDLEFGLVGLTSYVIDNLNASALLGGIKRNNKIWFNTGFFYLPVGVSTLYYNITGNVNIKIEYKQRYFL